MSPSVHQMAAHAWELFEINNGLPISMWAECPVEAWNKYIRAYKSGPACRARQNSIQNNIRDTFSRMLIMTHPKLSLRKRQLQCSKCGKQGHTVRSCNPVKPNTTEDKLIEDIFD